MLNFYPVEISRDLPTSHPLHVGKFFSLPRMWWTKRKQRQNLIISVAVAWLRLYNKNPVGATFISHEVLITALTSKIKDAKVVLERFFIIERIGFNFGDGNKSPTLVTPRRLSPSVIASIEELLQEATFNPGPQPTKKNLVISTVRPRLFAKDYVIDKLRDCDREDLIPAVKWVFTQEEIKFFFEPAGLLQARDKSVWPIRSIELWPGWLRTQVFGTVVDIANAYCQFLWLRLSEKYANNPARLEMCYPDIKRANFDKDAFRHELCDLLHLDRSDQSISAVKRIIMSLANGSNASPKMLVNRSTRSDAVSLVFQAAPQLSDFELIELGVRLAQIARQFRTAKRDLCFHLLGAKPTRENVKKIFSMYFEWEREARYKIWNAVGNTGLHLHDGIDGVILDMDIQDIPSYIEQQTSIRVTVDDPA